MTNNLRFSPETVTIRVGQTVQWVNSSSVAHTVTAVPDKAADPKDVHLPKGAQPFGSGIVSPGKTFTYTFTVPGRYKYFCIPHEFAGMIGKVIVKPAGQNAAMAATMPGQMQMAPPGGGQSVQAAGLPFVLGAHQPPRPPHYRDATGIAKFLYWLGSFHPASTTVTVGSILLAFLSEILLLVTRKKSFAITTRYCVWVGGLAALGTAALGWCFAGVYFYDQVSILTIHRIFGSVTGIWGPVLIVFSEVSRAKDSRGWIWAFRGALLVAVLLVAATGFLGGSMIYGIDHYAWPVGSGA